MDPAFLLNDLDPTNQFAMGGLNMAFASNLTQEGKPLPKTIHRHYDGEDPNVNKPPETFASRFILNGKYK